MIMVVAFGFFEGLGVAMHIYCVQCLSLRISAFKI